MVGSTAAMVKRAAHARTSKVEKTFMATMRWCAKGNCGGEEVDGDAASL